MIFILVSFLSFLLLIAKHLPLQLPSWATEMRLLSVLLCQESIAHSIHWFKIYKSVSTQILKFPSAMFTSKKNESRTENVAAMTVLDLPELALEMILEKLTPAGLLNMANVCTSLRDRCRSDHLWGRHFREKWGRVIGKSARKEWESYFMSMKECRNNGGGGTNWVLESLSCVWPCSWFVSRPGCDPLVSFDSVMAWYLALESGRFWFPAQVYNREQNGHVGFIMSCYDAELSYDSHTDTFHARYPPHEQRAPNIEEGVGWERLRAPPMDTPAHDLPISDCLHDLRPGDHIEIQWRRNKEFLYGWWYGVVGHLGSCDGDEHHCRCYNSDTVILEFNQYSPSSRWRRTIVDRKEHREEGNESDGFYGGIRKLYDMDEISMWRRLWPTNIFSLSGAVKSIHSPPPSAVGFSNRRQMMNGGPSGFHNAPVTRTFVITSALLSILLGIQGRSQKLGLSYQDIFQKVRLWRLIASVFAFSSTPELMFGLYLVYYFRVFERQIGSNKHSVFILFSVIVSSIFDVLALVYLKDSSNMLISGPYGLIFASFVPFYFDIPVSSRLSIFGVQFSDKSFVYLAGLQLLFSSWKRSLIPGICGVLAGSLYRLNLLRIQKMKFPDIVASSFSRLHWPSLSTLSHTSSTGNTTGNIPVYAGRQMEGNYPSTVLASAPELPSDMSVATLVSMGFDSDSARQALIHAGNDVNVATNILLEAQSR